MTPTANGTTAESNNDSNDTLAVGTCVVDSDADPEDRNTAVVVERPEEPAYAVHIEGLDASVADLNPEYGASGRVATVAFAGDLDAALDVWREADADALARICEDHEVQTYSYPVERLREAGDE